MMSTDFIQKFRLVTTLHYTRPLMNMKFQPYRRYINSVKEQACYGSS